MNLILIGHKSCGKSTVAKALADRLQKKFVDADHVLLKRHTEFDSLADLYQAVGEKRFREYESQCIAGLGLDNVVLATGGGVVLSSNNMQILKAQGLLIYLNTDRETLNQRNQSRAQHGVLAKGSLDEERFQLRHRLYQAYADITLDTANKAPEQLIEEIVGKIDGK